MNLPPHNPRGTDDEHRDQITLLTIGDYKRYGLRTLLASCEECGRNAVVNVAGFPDDLPCADVALKFRCSGCGSKRTRVTMNVPEYSALVERKTRWRSAGH